MRRRLPRQFTRGHPGLRHHDSSGFSSERRCRARLGFLVALLHLLRAHLRRVIGRFFRRRERLHRGLPVGRNLPEAHRHRLAFGVNFPKLARRLVLEFVVLLGHGCCPPAHSCSGTRSDTSAERPVPPMLHPNVDPTPADYSGRSDSAPLGLQ